MNNVKLVTVFAENKLGLLARITKVLADANVNIRWVTIATSGAFGVVKFLVDRYELAQQALKQKGFTVSLMDVLAIEVADRPGGLFAVTDCLARNQINVENSSGFVSNNRAVLLMEVQNADQARQTLAQQKLRLLTPEEVMQL